MDNWIVVGAGLSGAVYARELAEKGKRVKVVEARNHISGNCFDPIQSNLRIHKHGPHFFHTNSEKIWNYVNRFSSWRAYEHRVKGVVDGLEVPIPINLRSLEILFPSKANAFSNLIKEVTGKSNEISIAKLLESDNPQLKELAEYIYEKVFLGYSTKQWGMDPLELNPSVLARVPIRSNYDDRYFTDKYQALPNPGYIEFIGSILDHENIEINIGQEFTYSDLNKLSKDWSIGYTGAIDELLDYRFGQLPYRSLSFEYLEIDKMSSYFSAVQTNFPNNQEFTRITDYGKIWEETQNTILGYEYPSSYKIDENERYYPIPREENIEKYKKYKSTLEKEFPNVVLFGRLGDYKYYNMDQAIARALQVSSQI